MCSQLLARLIFERDYCSLLKSSLAKMYPGSVILLMARRSDLDKENSLGVSSPALGGTIRVVLLSKYIMHTAFLNENPQDEAELRQI